jgi:hypothetical protein
MNFNIYINNNLAKELDVLVTRTKKTRNKLIQEAIEKFIATNRKKTWCDAILAFKGVPGLDDWGGFEQHRMELETPGNFIFKD